MSEAVSSRPVDLIGTTGLLAPCRSYSSAAAAQQAPFLGPERRRPPPPTGPPAAASPWDGLADYELAAQLQRDVLDK